MTNMANKDPKYIQDNRDWGAFIPSFLDDFGLDMPSFRLYAHIARRAGSGTCWESIDSMAEICQMNRKTAYKAFKLLQDHKLVLVEKRKGQTSLVTLTHHSVWTPIPNQVQPPIPNQVHKVTPSEVTPSEVTPSEVTPSEVTPSKEDPYRATRKKSEPILEVLENSALVEKTIISEPMHELKKEIPPAPLSPTEINAITLTPKLITKSKRKAIEISDEDLLPFKHVWESDAPAHWTRNKDLTRPQKDALRRAIKEYGDRTMEIFQTGLAYARTDKDWCMKPDKRLSMCNYLTNGKPEEWAGKYQHLVNEGLATPISATGSGMESAEPEMTPTRLKMAQDYDMIGRALAKAGHMKTSPMRVAS